MSRFARAGVVLAGYLAAIGAGGVAAYLYDRRVSALPYDTSGGMYAGGEMLTSLAVFLAVALLPTLLALWFLRGHETFWKAVAVASLAFAVGGLLAVLSPLVVRASAQRGVGYLLVELLRVAHLLGTPLWAVAFGLFAFLAPSRGARRVLFGAVAVQVVVGALACIHWFVPRPPF